MSGTFLESLLVCSQWGLLVTRSTAQESGTSIRRAPRFTRRETPPFSTRSPSASTRSRWLLDEVAMSYLGPRWLAAGYIANGRCFSRIDPCTFLTQNHTRHRPCEWLRSDSAVAASQLRGGGDPVDGVVSRPSELRIIAGNCG